MVMLKGLKKEEAYEILRNMQEIMDRYGNATVSDLLCLSGCDENVSCLDGQRGWYSLRLAKIKKSGLFAYKIVLPSPVRLFATI